MIEIGLGLVGSGIGGIAIEYVLAIGGFDRRIEPHGDVRVVLQVFFVRFLIEVLACLLGRA